MQLCSVVQLCTVAAAAAAAAAATVVHARDNQQPDQPTDANELTFQDLYYNPPEDGAPPEDILALLEGGQGRVSLHTPGHGSLYTVTTPTHSHHRKSSPHHRTSSSSHSIPKPQSRTRGNTVYNTGRTVLPQSRTYNRTTTRPDQILPKPRIRIPSSHSVSSRTYSRYPSNPRPLMRLPLRRSQLPNRPSSNPTPITGSFDSQKLISTPNNTPKFNNSHNNSNPSAGGSPDASVSNNPNNITINNLNPITHSSEGSTATLSPPRAPIKATTATHKHQSIIKHPVTPALLRPARLRVRKGDSETSYLLSQLFVKDRESYPLFAESVKTNINCSSPAISIRVRNNTTLGRVAALTGSPAMLPKKHVHNDSTAHSSVKFSANSEASATPESLFTNQTDRLSATSTQTRSDPPHISKSTEKLQGNITTQESDRKLMINPSVQNQSPNYKLSKQIDEQNRKNPSADISTQNQQPTSKTNDGEGSSRLNNDIWDGKIQSHSPANSVAGQPSSWHHDLPYGRSLLGARSSSATLPMEHRGEAEHHQDRNQIYQYHYQDHLTGSYRFGYGDGMQWRHEERRKDGAVVGRYGWRDARGHHHVTHYLADARGYRLVQPGQKVRIYTSRPAQSSSWNRLNKRPSKPGLTTTKYSSTQTTPVTERPVTPEPITFTDLLQKLTAVATASSKPLSPSSEKLTGTITETNTEDLPTKNSIKQHQDVIELNTSSSVSSKPVTERPIRIKVPDPTKLVTVKPGYINRPSSSSSSSSQQSMSNTQNIAPYVLSQSTPTSSNLVTTTSTTQGPSTLAASATTSKPNIVTSPASASENSSVLPPLPPSLVLSANPPHPPVPYPSGTTSTTFPITSSSSPQSSTSPVTSSSVPSTSLPSPSTNITKSPFTTTTTITQSPITGTTPETESPFIYTTVTRQSPSTVFTSPATQSSAIFTTNTTQPPITSTTTQSSTTGTTPTSPPNTTVASLTSSTQLPDHQSTVNESDKENVAQPSGKPPSPQSSTIGRPAIAYPLPQLSPPPGPSHPHPLPFPNRPRPHRYRPGIRPNRPRPFHPIRFRPPQQRPQRPKLKPSLLSLLRPRPDLPRRNNTETEKASEEHSDNDESTQDEQEDVLGTSTANINKQLSPASSQLKPTDEEDSDDKYSHAGSQLDNTAYPDNQPSESITSDEAVGDLVSLLHSLYHRPFGSTSSVPQPDTSWSALLPSLFSNNPTNPALPPQLDILKRPQLDIERPQLSNLERPHTDILERPQLNSFELPDDNHLFPLPWSNSDVIRLHQRPAGSHQRPGQQQHPHQYPLDYAFMDEDYSLLGVEPVVGDQGGKPLQQSSRPQNNSTGSLKPQTQDESEYGDSDIPANNTVTVSVGQDEGSDMNTGHKETDSEGFSSQKDQTSAHPPTAAPGSEDTGSTATTAEVTMSPPNSHPVTSPPPTPNFWDTFMKPFNPPTTSPNPRPQPLPPQNFWEGVLHQLYNLPKLVPPSTVTQTLD